MKSMTSTGMLIIPPFKLSCLPYPNVRMDMNGMRGHTIRSYKNDKSCMRKGMSFKVANENLGHLPMSMLRWQVPHKVLIGEMVRPR